MLSRSRLILVNSIKKYTHHLPGSLSTTTTSYDPCTGCEIPCTKHVSYPPEILKEIDQSNLHDSVEKHRRHLCIGQSILPSQWPKDVKDLQGGYLQQLVRIFKEKQNAIGYNVKLTSAFIDSKQHTNDTANWYLFPDQLKLNDVNKEQMEEVIDRLFVQDQSIIKIKDMTKTIAEQLKERHALPLFHGEIICERLHGVWLLVCCHYQRDHRCGVIGPILIDEIEKYVRKINRTDDVHWLKISHIGGHRFAGNVIVYPTGTWYGRVLTCHVPLLIDAYTSSSKDFKDKLKPLLRGYLDTS